MSERTDTASRLIEAGPAAIYRAMIDADALVRWLPPDGMTAEMVHFDPRPGGSYRMILRYDTTSAGKSGANEDVVDVRFLDLVDDAKIVQAVDFVSDDPRFSGTMTMSWMLTPVGGATEVEIVATDVPEGIDARDHAAGLASSLDNLALFVQR